MVTGLEVLGYLGQAVILASSRDGGESAGKGSSSSGCLGEGRGWSLWGQKSVKKKKIVPSVICFFIYLSSLKEETPKRGFSLLPMGCGGE